MMRRKVLVDTSVVIDFFQGDETVREVMDLFAPVYVPVVVVAELLAGARRSQHVEKNVERIEEFADRSFVLSCDRGTADHYAEISNQLRARGTPIPQNDMWIAAVAQQHGLALATRDAHFAEVETVVRVPC